VVGFLRVLSEQPNALAVFATRLVNIAKTANVIMDLPLISSGF
jgi:hypothetical protein